MRDEHRERFMRRAIELGRKGAEAGDGGPFGAVVVRGDEVIGEGWNRVIARNDPTAHAEMEAIRDACGRLGSYSLQDCDIYASGEPCPMCLGAIYWANMARVFYGFSIEDAAEAGFRDSLIYEQLILPLEEREISMVQMLGDQALETLRAFAADPDRVRY